jgi:capsular polysaccharide biosynthesis protein
MNSKFSLESFIKLIKQNYHVLLIWMVTILSLSALYTFYIVEPAYQSTSKLVVNDTPEGSQSITSLEIDTNLSLINTYQGVMMEPIILEEVIEQTGIDYSVDGLSEKVTFENDEMSLIFGVSVKDSNPIVAAKIANTMAEVFQEQIVDILPVRSVTILSQAVPAAEPVSPNVGLNLLFGGMAGLFLGYLHIVLKDLVDKRVRTVDIIAEMDWIHLGSISLLSEKEMKDTELLTHSNREVKQSELYTEMQKER